MPHLLRLLILLSVCLSVCHLEHAFNLRNWLLSPTTRHPSPVPPWGWVIWGSAPEEKFCPLVPLGEWVGESNSHPAWGHSQHFLDAVLHACRQ